MANIKITVRIADGESTTTADYTINPAMAAASPEYVGAVAHVLADRVIRALGLPTPADMDDAGGPYIPRDEPEDREGD